MSPEISHAQMVGAERGRFFNVSLYAMILSTIKILFRFRPLYGIACVMEINILEQCDPLKQIPYE